MLRELHLGRHEKDSLCVIILTHWSSAFYRDLNIYQFTDGKSILNINRDDASGYHLNTLSTHKQYKSLVVDGKQVLATHTDYVN